MPPPYERPEIPGAEFLKRASDNHTGIAIRGPGFYVWDAEPHRAEDWARELSAAAPAVPSGRVPGGSGDDG